MIKESCKQLKSDRLIQEKNSAGIHHVNMRTKYEQREILKTNMPQKFLTLFLKNTHMELRRCLA